MLEIDPFLRFVFLSVMSILILTPRINKVEWMNEWMNVLTTNDIENHDLKASHAINSLKYLLHVIRMSFVCTRMSHLCHSYVTCTTLLCTLKSSVCHLYVLICHSFVTRIYSYVNLMSLVCTRMSSACHSSVILPWTLF